MIANYAKRLLARAEEYEAKAHALRLAVIELEGEAIESSTRTLGSKLERAAALRESHRVSGHGILARGALRDRLAAIDPARSYTLRELQEAIASPGMRPPGVSSMRYWLRRLGWRASSTGSDATWAQATKKTTTATKNTATKKPGRTVRANRARTAKILERLQKAAGPVPASFFDGIAPVGILSRYGYIARDGAGWVRTAKEFTP